MEWETIARVSAFAVATLMPPRLGMLLEAASDFSTKPQGWPALSGLIGSVFGCFSASTYQVAGSHSGSVAGVAARNEQPAQPPQPPLPSMAKAIESPDGGGTIVAVAKPKAKELVPAASPATAQPGAQADQRWNDCVAFVLRREGGFSNDPADRGGPTNRGITLGTLAHFRGAPVTEDDVRKLTEAETRQIYRQHYWDLICGDDLPAGVDLCAFDAAVLCGPGQAGRFVQLAAQMTGPDVDGRIGLRTVQAVANHEPASVVDAIAEERTAYHRDCVRQDPTQQRFLEGWLDRVRDMRQTALRMAGVPDDPLVS